MGKNILKSNLEQVQKLTAKAMELNRDGFHVFVSFSGHVCSVDIRWHYGGWRESAYYSDKISFYANHKITNKKFEGYFRTLQEASDNNEILREKAKKRDEEKERARYERLKKKFEGKKAALTPSLIHRA
ncbi:MAG: hypothetical protein ACUZ8E_17320 [Candidatus Anammoxibacter sp.]